MPSRHPIVPAAALNNILAYKEKMSFQVFIIPKSSEHARAPVTRAGDRAGRAAERDFDAPDAVFEERFGTGRLPHA